MVKRILTGVDLARLGEQDGEYAEVRMSPSLASLSITGVSLPTAMPLPLNPGSIQPTSTSIQAIGSGVTFRS